MGNNQMLVGDTETGEIRRFIVGPKECEITGSTFAPTARRVFVGVQHPGEKGKSNFPDGGNSVPRSCIIAISREDVARLSVDALHMCFDRRRRRAARCELPRLL